MYHTCFICHVSIHVSKVLHVLRRSCTKYVLLLKSVQSSGVVSITTYQNNSEHLSNSLDECSDSDCTSLNFNLCCSPSMSSGKWWYILGMGGPLIINPIYYLSKKKKVCILLGIWGYLLASVCLLRTNPTWLAASEKDDLHLTQLRRLRFTGKCDGSLRPGRSSWHGQSNSGTDQVTWDACQLCHTGTWAAGRLP